MATIYHLSLGSNCGNRKKNICAAIDWLIDITDVSRYSEIFETDSVNGDGTRYCNCVLICESDLAPDAFENVLKEYELRNGRTAECRARGEVPVDIDIVCVDGRVVRPRDYNRQYFIYGLKLIEETDTRNK